MKRLIAALLLLPLLGAGGELNVYAGKHRFIIPASTSIALTGNTCIGYSGSSTVSSQGCTLTVANAGDAVVIYASGHVAGWTVSGSSASCGTPSVFRTGLPSWYSSSFQTNLLVVPNASAGSCVISITPSSSLGYFVVEAVDVAHPNGTTPIDNASCASSPYCTFHSQTTTPSASITTTNANELVIAFLYIPATGGQTITPGSPFTWALSSGVNTQGFADYLEATAGGYTPGFTISSSSPLEETVVALTK